MADFLSDADVGFGQAGPAASAAGPKLLSDAEVGIAPPRDADSFAGTTEFGQPYAAPADKPAAQSLPAAVAQSVPQGLASGVGAAIAGAGRIAQAGTGPSAQRVLASLDLIDAGKVRDAYQGLTDDERQKVAAYRGGGPDDKTALRADLQQTIQDYATPNAAMRTGAAIEQAAPAMFPVAPENEGVGTGVGRMVGGVVPALAAGAVGGPPGLLASFATIGSQAYDSAYQDAVSHGATHEEADDAAGKAAVAQALTMTVPVSRLLQRVPMPLRDGFTKTLVSLGQNGVEFGTANALGTFANNYVASQTYDPNRPLTQGTGQAALEGTIAGLIVPAVGGVFHGGGAAPAQSSPSTIADTVMKAPDITTAIDAATKAAQAPDTGTTGTEPASWGDLFGQSTTEQSPPPFNPNDPSTYPPTISGTVSVGPRPVGAAASAAGDATMSPEEAAENRYQGEVERLAAPPKPNDTTVYIPGVRSTAAEITGDPRTAMDQAYNRQQPQAMGEHDKLANETADQIAAYVADTAGSAPTLGRMERARTALANENIQQIFGDPDLVRPPADTTSTLDLMNSMLANPRGAERDSVVNVISKLANKFYDAKGNPKTDPYALYGIGEHINDLLDGVGDPEAVAGARVLRRELTQIKESLYDNIENAAPGFAKYRADYAADSQAITAMKFLQDARLSLLSGTSQHITPAKWFNFMRGVVEGRADPMDPASALSDDQMTRLWNVTDQLKRSTFIDAGKPRGSWTSMMQEWGGRFARMGAHAVAGHVLPGVGNLAVEAGVGFLRNRNVMNEMNRLLYPDLGQYETAEQPPPSTGFNRDRSSIAASAAAPEATAQPVQAGMPQPVAPALSPPAPTAPTPPVATAAGAFGSTAYSPAGTAVPVRYTVRDASDLTASQLPDGRPNPAYPAELQPRDRTRAASQQQVDQIAARLQPERLGASASTAEGAPIVGPDGIVESGNGRTMAIQQAYANGGPRADAYRQWVASQGYDVSGIKNPVLVRERTSDLDLPARARLAADMGGSPVAGMSAPERAAMDARAIPSDTLTMYQGGDVTQARNAPFARAFAEHVVPPGERANFITSDGELSQEGATRVRNALTQYAYGSNALVTSLAEHADPDIKAFGGAMMDASGGMAKLRGAINNGDLPERDDLAPRLIEAARLIQTAKRQRISLLDATKQSDIENPPPSARTIEILKAAFGDNLSGRMSRARLGDLLTYYADKQIAQVQEGMFGANQSTDEIFADARARYGSGTKAGTGRGGVPQLPLRDGAGTGGDGPQTRGPPDDQTR